MCVSECLKDLYPCPKERHIPLFAFYSAKPGKGIKIEGTGKLYFGAMILNDELSFFTAQSTAISRLEINRSECKLFWFAILVKKSQEENWTQNDIYNMKELDRNVSIMESVKCLCCELG